MSKHPLSDKHSPEPHETQWTRQCVCPHWSPSDRACLLVKDGLFLPVEQHVAVYCMSCHFPSCRQYQTLAEPAIHQGKDGDLPINRRRSIRIPSYHNFRFSEITGSDQLPGQRDDDAWTIDLSAGGIRFASRHPLNPDTTIHFFLEPDGMGAPVEGSGRVIWSEPLENTPLFHAGIAFAEPPPSTSPLFHFPKTK